MAPQPVIPKLTMGVGATVSIKMRLVHPYPIVRNSPNYNQTTTIRGTVTGLAPKTINKKLLTAVLFNTDDIQGIGSAQVYACFRYFTVEEEGPEEEFFVKHNGQVALAVPQNIPVGEELADEVYEIVVAHNEGVAHPIDLFDEIELPPNIPVDNDNHPAPENVNQAVGGECIYNENWGHDGSCNRLKANNHEYGALLHGRPDVSDIVGLFELLFPKKFIEDVVIPSINSATHTPVPVTYGEFLRFIGIFFYISTIEGPARRDFWSKRAVQPFKGAPFRVNRFMSRDRFELILYNMKFTLKEPPLYADRFFHIRELVEAFNKNLSDNFSSSSMSCLDESMMAWTSKFTCPGFMFVPRKPHPFGNEWHTICCAKSGILFALEIVEGRDRPPEVVLEFDEKGKTVGLLLRLTKSLWGTGKMVVLDSGFCVLQAIIELKKKGVFASAVIKKRRYWPRYIKGETIKGHFANKEVGDVDSWGGTFQGVPFDIFCMKDVDYVSSFMSTYGTNNRRGEEHVRDLGGEKKRFQYPEVIYNHYQNRHAVDDHNNKRHSPISFEKRWGSPNWNTRVFSFLLAVTEVNVMLADKYFYQAKHATTLEFRHMLAEKLIYNKYFVAEHGTLAGHDENVAAQAAAPCWFNTVEVNFTFQLSQLVRGKSPYMQRKCIGCAHKVRTYCACTPGIYRCAQCYGNHREFGDIMNELEA